MHFPARFGPHTGPGRPTRAHDSEKSTRILNKFTLIGTFTTAPGCIDRIAICSYHMPILSQYITRSNHPCILRSESNGGSYLRHQGNSHRTGHTRHVHGIALVHQGHTSTMHLQTSVCDDRCQCFPPASPLCLRPLPRISSIQEPACTNLSANLGVRGTTKSSS